MVAVLLNRRVVFGFFAVIAFVVAAITFTETVQAAPQAPGMSNGEYICEDGVNVYGESTNSCPNVIWHKHVTKRECIRFIFWKIVCFDTEFGPVHSHCTP